MQTEIGSQLVNIAHLTHSTTNLGPGNRAVVWVQGCPHRCPGCIAPEWLSFEDRWLISPEDLAAKLLFSNEIRGLTFSGGDPMAQAAGLAQVARIARQSRDLDIICFSGYRYEQLVHNPPNAGVPELLKEVDVLIDGPYIRSQNDGVGLRGSSNQRIIHLTNRLKGFDLEHSARSVDISFMAGEMVMTGIPPLSLEPILNMVSKYQPKPQPGAAI